MKLRYWIAGGIALAGGGSAAWTLSQRGPRRRPRNYRLNLAPVQESPGPDAGSVLFIGTATTLIQYRGLTLLTDPNFLHHGDQVHMGFGAHSTRLTNPALAFDDLPPVDFVLLSHLHEIHFDKLVERRLAKDIPILTTASAARALARRGFTRTVELRPWDAVNVDKGDVALRITAVPATHGAIPVSVSLPAVTGSMLEFRSRGSGTSYRIYISGDTVAHEGMKEIARRFPNVDLALLHLGGTRVLGVTVTMDAEQGVRALRMVDPKQAIPIHYNDYDVFKEPLEEFKLAVERAGLSGKVHYLRHGEIYSFSPAVERRQEGVAPTA